MSYWKNVFVVWDRIFRNFRYVVLALVVAFVFYMLNGLILNFRNIGTFVEVFGFWEMLNIMFYLSLNFYENVMVWGAVWTFILSLLAGMLVSLLVYRTQMLNFEGRGGLLGGIGVFFGAAAPGCAVCGVGLAGIFGLGSALAVLPFKGHEIIVLAVVLVSFSVVKISGKLYNLSCSIKLNEK